MKNFKISYLVDIMNGVENDGEKVRIAIEGCCHGELDAIYDNLIKNNEKSGSELPELLIICGDFQAIRNKYDLECISIPPKYQKIGDFREYYSGNKKAPLLTIFVGGNHEASNYLDELKYGGWVAPNIYFLGHSGVVWYKGLRISGISGIWNLFNFNKPRLEIVPYENPSFIKSAYHVRKLDFIKQYLIRENLSIMVSHDWPKDIVYSGSVNWLLQNKPFFKKDIQTGRLGSEVNKVLLHKLRPLQWYSAHLHVRFTALVDHTKTKRRISAPQEAEAKKLKGSSFNNNEIVISLSSDESDEEELSNETNATMGQEHNAQEIQINMEDSSEDELPTYEKPVEETGSKEVENVVRETGTENTEKLVEETTKHMEKGGEEAKDAAINGSEILETPPQEENQFTEFLALDKCLPRRRFLEFRHVPVTSSTHPSFHDNNLYLDKEYIAITRAVENSFVKTEFYKSLNKFENIFNLDQNIRKELEREVDIECSKLDKMSPEDFIIHPEAFAITAPPDATRLALYSNPQTSNFITRFGL